MERPPFPPPPQLLLRLNLGLWNRGGILAIVPLDTVPSTDEMAPEDEVVREAPDGGLIASGAGVVPRSVHEVEVLFFFGINPFSLLLPLLATAAMVGLTLLLPLLLLLLLSLLVVVSAFAGCSLPVPFTSPALLFR